MRKVLLGLVTLLLVPTASALTWVGDTAYDQLSKDEVLAEGTYADVVLMGEHVTLTRDIRGDALLLGQTVKTSAKMQDVRVAAMNAELGGTMQSLAVFGGVVVLPVGTVVEGDVWIRAQKIVLAGEIRGKARLEAQDVVVEGGKIAGDAEIRAGNTLALPVGAVGGKLTYSAPTKLDIPGEYTATHTQEVGFTHEAVAVAFLTLFILGLGVSVVQGHGLELFRSEIREHCWKSFFVGLGLFFLPLIALLLCVIPGFFLVGVTTLLGGSALALMGFSLVGMAPIALLPLGGLPSYTALLAGYVLLYLLTFIPFIGGSLLLLLMVLSLGAFARMRYGLYLQMKKR